ncbi:MAG: P1 family peptidase [Tissierellia bacterium]|nr:P1 family peptidase [Tissierellia bacterium]
MNGYLDDIEGIKVGHYTNEESRTGSTVIVFDEGAVCAADIRGGAPGTRETDLLNPECLVEKVNAILLTGGSAFGLDAASGVVNVLEKRKMGFKTEFAFVPIVPAAVIYDLGSGDGKRPDFNYGKYATENALNFPETQRLQGRVGAGRGALVGKALGNGRTMKGGLGSFSLKSGDLIVSALIVVNAFGDIYDREGLNQIAGPLDDEGNMLSTEDLSLEFNNKNSLENTTIGVIATNARLTKSELKRICISGHDAFARSIRPVHTILDGDTLFAASIGNLQADIIKISVMAQKAVSAAIELAIKNN